MKILQYFTPLFVSLALTSCASTEQVDVYKNLSAKQIYTQGKNNAKQKKYKQAIKDFEAVESHYPYGEYAEKAQLALTHAYFNDHDSASALATIDRFIRLHPRHKNIDFAYYMRGVINYYDSYSKVYKFFPLDRSKRSPEIAETAFKNFKLLLEDYPNSKYAPDAAQRMLNLREQLANHELHVAKYYLQKEAYIAAINRANYILEYFGNTTVVHPALTLMVTAYTKLGMHDLATTTKAIINKNFSS